MSGVESAPVIPRKDPTALVVTSIAAPNAALRSLAHGAQRRGLRFLLVGDSKSPTDFELEGCEYYGLAAQRESGLQYAAVCPERSYARKNIGYLLAIRDGARVLVETDDDNFPRDAFWAERRRHVEVKRVDELGWVNVYRYFSDAMIWPRGLPLEAIRREPPRFEDLAVAAVDCPIQQGLADENPDVDAVYRLVCELPQSFRMDRRVALRAGAWCPFNSQNTTWWADAFPLMYLPSQCSFRMTDNWRSFVAQRIAWENGWSVQFHEATVWQERNEHDLLRDFRDEVPGYLLNSAIADRLKALSLNAGVGALADNMRRCYSALIEMGAVAMEETGLLEAWLRDITEIHVESLQCD